MQTITTNPFGVLSNWNSAEQPWYSLNVRNNDLPMMHTGSRFDFLSILIELGSHCIAIFVLFWCQILDFMRENSCTYFTTLKKTEYFGAKNPKLSWSQKVWSWFLSYKKGDNPKHTFHSKLIPFGVGKRKCIMW